MKTGFYIAIINLFWARWSIAGEYHIHVAPRTVLSGKETLGAGIGGVDLGHE